METLPSKPVVIPLSKGKIFLTLLGSLAFVALGIWFLGTKDPELSSPVVKVVGGVAVLFFGACGLFALTKLFDFRPGLVIDAEGIIDNSSAVAAGRIRWEEITGLSVTTIQRTQILNILVRSPEALLEGKGRLARLAGSANIGMTGTPVNISSHALKVRFDDLGPLIHHWWVAHHQTGPTPEPTGDSPTPS